jgi:hypothetical protein
MGAVIAIDALLHERRVWRGQPAALPPSAQPTGHAALDAALPTGGWPEGALSELLIPVDGVGELQLLWPTLARLSQASERIVLIAPPYVPFAPAWQAAGIALRQMQVIEAGSPRDALWATEQCLRSGSCGAVLCWPLKADDRACAGCRSPPNRDARWRSRPGRSPPRAIPRRRRCASPLTRGRRSCPC